MYCERSSLVFHQCPTTSTTPNYHATVSMTHRAIPAATPGHWTVSAPATDPNPLCTPLWGCPGLTHLLPLNCQAACYCMHPSQWESPRRATNTDASDTEFNTACNFNSTYTNSTHITDTNSKVFSIHITITYVCTSHSTQRNYTCHHAPLYNNYPCRGPQPTLHSPMWVSQTGSATVFEGVAGCHCLSSDTLIWSRSVPGQRQHQSTPLATEVLLHVSPAPMQHLPPASTTTSSSTTLPALLTLLTPT